jgi:hypothetical protein
MVNRVYVLGFMGRGLRLRVQGLWIRVKGSRFIIQAVEVGHGWAFAELMLGACSIIRDYK